MEQFPFFDALSKLTSSRPDCWDRPLCSSPAKEFTLKLCNRSWLFSHCLWGLRSLINPVRPLLLDNSPLTVSLLWSAHEVTKCLSYFQSNTLLTYQTTDYLCLFLIYVQMESQSLCSFASDFFQSTLYLWESSIWLCVCEFIRSHYRLAFWSLGWEHHLAVAGIGKFRSIPNPLLPQLPLWSTCLHSSLLQSPVNRDLSNTQIETGYSLLKTLPFLLCFKMPPQITL